MIDLVSFWGNVVGGVIAGLVGVALHEYTAYRSAAQGKKYTHQSHWNWKLKQVEHLSDSFLIETPNPKHQAGGARNDRYTMLDLNREIEAQSLEAVIDTDLEWLRRNEVPMEPKQRKLAVESLEKLRLIFEEKRDE